MKYTRLNGFKIQTTFNKTNIIIGKDRGSRDVKTFYYIEVNGTVIQHGFGTQRDAKKYVADKVTKILPPINDDVALEKIADEQGIRILNLK